MKRLSLLILLVVFVIGLPLTAHVVENPRTATTQPERFFSSLMASAVALSEVPEPISVGLFGGGLLMWGAGQRRRYQKAGD